MWLQSLYRRPSTQIFITFWQRITQLPSGHTKAINLLNPTGYMMRQQFNIQQLFALPTLYLCVLYLSENKQ